MRAMSRVMSLPKYGLASSRLFASVSVDAPKKIIYFGINCKCNATPTICLEIAKLPYEAQIVDMGTEWPTMKPTTPTGSLPVVELADGTQMGESAVCKRACAAAAGLLGEGKDYYTSELLVTLMDDLWNSKMFPNLPHLLNASTWTAEQTATANAAVATIEADFEKVATYLLPAGDRFTSTGTCVGEIDLWHRLHQLSNGVAPKVSQGKLAKFYERMQAVEGVKNFVEGRSKFGDAGKVNLFVPMPDVK